MQRTLAPTTDWKTTYRANIVTAEEAVRVIRSNSRVFMTGNCSVPQKILAALVDYAPQLQNVEICHALTVCCDDYVKPDMEGHLRVNSLFISANVRKAVQDGRADFTPTLLSEVPLLFKKGILPVDVALVHLSPPDRHGFCTYGLETGLTRTAAESAKILVAEINEQMPRMMGDTLIHISDIDYIVPVDYPTGELAMASDDNHDITVKIAGFIAERIPDGATLQTGIGAIPDSVLRFLADKKDLGIHTELFSEGVIDLVQKGVINGAAKTIHKGKIIAGFLIGTRRLYDWVDDNPMVELYRTEYVNNPFTIARNNKMVAINSAIEVDLTGQVCADSIGTKFFSGVGGQTDFIYGAGLSEGGMPIIAMPSTTTLRDGTTVSRIVTMLKPGAGVTVTRNHIHFVATEHGMVDLYGQTIRERVKRLASIAHPDFRDQLLADARKLHYI